jgi:hypothetical protein
MKFVRVHNSEYLAILGAEKDYRAWNGESFMK